MLTNITKGKPLIIILIILLVLGVAGGAYYYLHQNRSAGQAVCTEVDEGLLELAAGLMHTSEHKQLGAIMERYEQTCSEYTRAADYQYLALRYYIIQGDHANARKHLDQLKSLPREHMVLDEYGQTYNNATLESTVSFMEEAARDSSANDDDGVDEFTKEPGT